MKSRILQAIILIIVFVTAIVLFNSGSSSAPVEDNSGYLPPSP